MSPEATTDVVEARDSQEYDNWTDLWGIRTIIAAARFATVAILSK
jgi:hypothetical protein